MAGNIRTIPVPDNFQKVDRGIIFNKEVDSFTLGIYVKILALGETDWNLNIVGFASYLGITEAKVRRAFAILEKVGYLRRIHIKDEKSGYFTGWDYEIGAIPLTECDRIQPYENPKVGKSKVWENQPVENRGTNIDSKDNIDNKGNLDIINNIYKLYPTKCPISERNTGKCAKNKKQIATLLKTKKPEELERTIKRYLNECTKSNTYIKNFSTFLNQLPEFEEESKYKKVEWNEIKDL